MNFLAELLSSNVRAAIFRNLFGINQGAMYIREIERKTGFSIGAVQTEIRKLVRLDLIVREADGNRVYYRANTEHPVYPDIRNIVLKTIGLADVLRSHLSEENKIKIAFVFGSIAGGQEKAQSDIDLFVIGDIGLRRLSELLAGASEKVGREINSHVFSESEFTLKKRKADHFISDVLANEKIFIIGSENELKKMG